MARSTILPEDRDLSEEELAAERPVVRQILVLELQAAAREAHRQALLSEQLSERGMDPRWVELKIRAYLGIARLMGVDRAPVVEQPQPDVVAGADPVVLRREVLGLLQAAAPGS